MKSLSRTITVTIATVLMTATLVVAGPASAANAATLATGSGFTCAITAKGALKCWGYNEYGQLGTGGFEPTFKPKQVKGLKKNVLAVAARGSHACAIRGKGELLCWGGNDYGQVGDGSLSTARPAPTKVKKMGKGVVAVAAGPEHTCAIKGKKRTLFCWGANYNRRLGIGSDVDEQPIPVKVKNMDKGVVAVAAGGEHTCAIKGKKRTLFCWGVNSDGQVGTGTDADMIETPVKVKNMDKGVVGVTAGQFHTCAIKGKGALFCWGYDFYRQLGDGAGDSTTSTPAKVKTMDKGVVGVTAGGFHTCAIKGKGALHCWGSNADGETGDGTNEPTRDVPVKVKKMNKKVVEVTAGRFFTCAFKGKGLFCWGRNSDGQIGDGTNEDPRPTPKKVKL